MRCEDKTAHRNRRAARLVMEREHAIMRRHGNKTRLRVYKCAKCFWWHLTHVPKKSEVANAPQA